MHNAAYAINTNIVFQGKSKWYLIQTIESFNGQRFRTDYGTFVEWYSANAFGGTNFSGTPVGAVSNTDEPGDGIGSWNDPAVLFGLWEAGKNFGACAWISRRTGHYQAVGDPLIKH